MRLPFRLDRRQLHFLHQPRRVARFVAQNDHRECRRKAEARGHGERADREADIARPQQIPGRYAEHEHARRDIARRHGMHELGLRDRVEQHRREVGELHAHRFVIEIGADRILHPSVRNQDPERGKVRSQRHQERHQQMLHLAEPVPTEKEQAHHRRLEDERHHPFDCQRHAENIADVVRVIGPVGPELEFERQTGRHAHDEIDAEQKAPETRHVAIDLAAGHHVDRFHDDQHPGKPERQGDEQEVVQRSRRELKPRNVDEVEVGHRVPGALAYRLRRGIHPRSDALGVDPALLGI